MLTMKRVIFRLHGHLDGIWGTFLDLECGHTEWRRGNVSPKRCHCVDCHFRMPVKTQQPAGAAGERRNR